MLSKKNNGITLVALVITIVILLILAGISISPQTPLNRPEKPLRFFWTFPARFVTAQNF